jgi:hypothetical protein
MPRIADLIERINQGVLALWLERNAQVNGRSGRRMALAFPLLRNGAPRVPCSHVVPTWGKGGETKRDGGKGGQHGEPVHGCPSRGLQI